MQSPDRHLSAAQSPDHCCLTSRRNSQLVCAQVCLDEAGNCHPCLTAQTHFMQISPAGQVCFDVHRICRCLISFCATSVRACVRVLIMSTDVQQKTKTFIHRNSDSRSLAANHRAQYWGLSSNHSALSFRLNG